MLPRSEVHTTVAYTYLEYCSTKERTMRKSSVSSSCMTPKRAGRSSVANFGGRPSSSSRNKGRLSNLRLSGVSMGRPSSAMVTALTGRPSYQEPKAESKPQSDRSAFPKNLKSLITFLNENQYPFPLNKLQSSPSAKDVISIFEFLVSKLLSEFNFKNKKFEDTFPQVLISECLESLEMAAGAASTINQPSKAEVMIQFHVQPFNEYVDGGDDFTALDREYSDKVPHLLGLDDYKFLEDLEQEVLAIEDKVNVYKTQTNEIQERVFMVEVDYEKLQTFVEEIRAYQSQLDEQIEFQQKEAQEHELKLASLVEEINDREALIANQKITPEEAMKLRQKITDLDSQVSRADETLRKLREELCNGEAYITKTRNEVVTIMERFNGTAENCQLIPTTAANASNHDYEMKPSILDSEDSIQFIDIENRIDLILKQFKSKVRELNCKEMETSDGLLKLSEMITAVKGEIADIKAKIRREDEGLEIARQENCAAIQKLQSELDNEEKEIMNVKFNLKTTEDMAKMQSEAKERRKRFEELKLGCIEKAKERESFMVNAYEKVLKYNQRIQERAEKCAAVTESVLKATKKAHIEVKVSRLDDNLTNLCNKMTTLDL